MLWVDETDPSVLDAVTRLSFTEAPSDADVSMVRDALAVASEVLTLATGHLVHPAGEQTEEFVAGTVRRLSPLYGPVTRVVSLALVAEDGTERPLTGWRKVGNTVHLALNQTSGSLPLWRVNRIGSACGPEQQVYRLVYQFASTMTYAAQAAVIEYAHQIWLGMVGSDECALPERTTSVTREGIGIELMTPQDFLDRGRTGLPQVDTWLSQANPKRALRPSAVYTPDSPPGVGVRTRRL